MSPTPDIEAVGDDEMTHTKGTLPFSIKYPDGKLTVTCSSCSLEFKTVKEAQTHLLDTDFHNRFLSPGPQDVKNPREPTECSQPASRHNEPDIIYSQSNEDIIYSQTEKKNTFSHVGEANTETKVSYSNELDFGNALKPHITGAAAHDKLVRVKCTSCTKKFNHGKNINALVVEKHDVKKPKQPCQCSQATSRYKGPDIIYSRSDEENTFSDVEKLNTETEVELVDQPQTENLKQPSRCPHCRISFHNVADQRKHNGPYKICYLKKAAKKFCDTQVVYNDNNSDQKYICQNAFKRRELRQVGVLPVYVTNSNSNVTTESRKCQSQPSTASQNVTHTSNSGARDPTITSPSPSSSAQRLQQRYTLPWKPERKNNRGTASGITKTVVLQPQIRPNF